MNRFDQPNGFRSFTPNAPTQYQIEGKVGFDYISIFEHRFDSQAADFLHRWAPELNETQAAHPSLTPQFVCAYAVAGDEYSNQHQRIRYHGNLIAQLAPNFPAEYLNGDRRQVWVRAGMFDFPLPLARILLNNKDLSAEDLLKPQTSFKLIQIAGARAYSEFYQVTHHEPDPVQLAIGLHSGGIHYASTNPHRVQYRKNFLPDFISAYNAAFLIISKKGIQS